MGKRFRGYSVKSAGSFFKPFMLMSLLFSVGITVGALSARNGSTYLSEMYNSAFAARNTAGFLACFLMSAKVNVPILSVCFLGSLTVFGPILPISAVVFRGILCGYVASVMYQGGLFGFYFAATLMPQFLLAVLLIAFAVATANSSAALTRLAISGRSNYDLPSALKLFVVFMLLNVICCVADGAFSWIYFLIF